MKPGDERWILALAPELVAANVEAVTLEGSGHFVPEHERPRSASDGES